MLAQRSFLCSFCLVISFLAALGLRFCVQSCSSRGAWASHCRGFSCCRAWGLGTRA